jgi:tetratricopeptide (TPR) repeat protein
MSAAYIGKASVLVALGDLDAAQAAAQAALACEPLSPGAAISEVAVAIWRGEIERAVRRGARAVELHAFSGPARIHYGMALELQGERARALDEYRAASLFAGQLPWSQSLEAACLANMGRLQDARRICAGLQARRRTEYIDPYAMARIHLALGSVDQAFDELSQAVNDRVRYIDTVTVDPLVEGFRKDPRFDGVVKQLRLPAERIGRAYFVPPVPRNSWTR